MKAKKNLILFIILINGLFTFGQGGITYPMGALSGETQISLSMTELELSPASSECPLPIYVDNSTLPTPYFPTVFLQQGESCSQASTISNCFTYEMNRLRNDTVGYWNIPDETLYYYFYTYNFLNDGTDTIGTSYSSGYNIVYENGIPNYGEYYHDSLFGMGRFKYWMSGYEKHLQGKANTIRELNKVTFTTELDCLTNLKHWLSDHNEGEGYIGGVATIVPYFHDDSCVNLPNSDEKILVRLSHNTDPPGHALTVVGYNDTIGFDFNNDGYITDTIDINGDSVVNLLDCEIGALRVVNSWGTLWGNMGKAWFPYHFLASNFMQEDFAFFCHVEDAELPDYELKVELTHEARGRINLGIGYASDASIDSISTYSGYELMTAYNRQGGDSIPMRGVSDDPIELALNFGKVYKDVDFGKVFFKVHEFDHHDYFDGEIAALSLIDYRWDETFEIFCEQEHVPIISLDHTILSIDYDLIPHEDTINEPLTLFSDMVCRFKPVIEDSLIIENISIDMYESTIHFTENSFLEIQDSAIIHAKKGDCKIIIDGGVDFGENITFKADSAASLLIVINKEDLTYTINNCKFINSAVNSFSKAPVITNCDFQNSSIYCKNNYGSNDTAIISYNKFADAVDSTAIAIEKFNAFTIENNEIDNCLQGISLSECGRSSSTNQNIINNNISDCNGVGINTSNSFSNILKNLIEKCDIGIKLHNKSTTCLAGDTNTLYIENMNRVYNCDSYEVYFSKNSYPWYFHYNVISDYDNGGNSVGDPMLYYDPENTEMSTIQDAEYNCWGDNFSPSADLYPDTLIDHLPIYCPPASPEETKAVETQYQTNLDLMAEEEYTQSKSGFMSIIEQNPGTKYAQSAMRELIDLEKYAGNDYTALKTYYQTNTTIQSDSILAPLASKLANDCDIELQNYTAAITYFEDVIQNPADIQDSIFAIINLGDLYENISTSNKASLVGKMPQYKPRSAKQFNKYKYELLSMLPVTKEAQTGTRDYRSDTYRDFTIRPNPVNNIAMLCFTLIEDGSVCFEIHNAEGVLLQSISEGYHQTGQHEIQYNASKLKPGLYYCSLVVNGEVMETRKMVVVR